MTAELDESEATSGSSTSTRTYTAPSWHEASTPRPPLLPSASTPSEGPPRRTLKETSADLLALFRVLLIFIPLFLRRLQFIIPRFVVRLGGAIAHRLAASLHRRDILASFVLYDVLVFPWRAVVTIFFREIKSRGAFKVPREGDGAVIFCTGPHSNQFVDGLLLMSEARRHTGRRVEFLWAAKSFEEPFIGSAAKLMKGIPVVRPQDVAFRGPGTLTLSPDDPLLVIGFGTSFVDMEPKSKLMLGKDCGGGTGDIAEVLDDTHLRLSKPFSATSAAALLRNPAGANYKILPHIDQTEMYASVFGRLASGGSLGIFPEGGSHDRADFLPLKAGISMMALGAVAANPSLKLRIVPVGLSYFHPDKFRSRAVVEFGTPIEITKDQIQQWESGGDEKKEAVASIMASIVSGLKSVTVRAPDFETLMLIQATSRLYRPPGQRLTLGQVTSLTRRFAAGYEVYKDAPPVRNLITRVAEYNTSLRHLGLKDHQIKHPPRPFWRTLVLFLWRVLILSVWSVFALPGVALNAPIFIAAKVISKRKAREALAGSSVKLAGRDVIATWKILVALAGGTTLYTIYSIGATILAFELDLPFICKIGAPFATWAGLPLIGYFALKFGEVGVDVYKSLRPLFLSLLPGNSKQLDDIRRMRASLRHDISDVVEEFGPKLFEDFQQARLRRPSVARDARPARPVLRRNDSGSAYGAPGSSTFHGETTS
ncbi:hypothetical protein RQP46_000284 [Phenoliferia psychrophenolica]